MSNNFNATLMHPSIGTSSKVRPTMFLAACLALALAVGLAVYVNEGAIGAPSGSDMAEYLIGP